MYLYLAKLGVRMQFVGGVVGNLSIPAGQDLVYTVPEDQLANFPLGDSEPDEYGLEVLIDAGVYTSAANKDLYSGAMVRDNLGNSYDDGTNEGTLAAGATAFTDAVGPLDPNDCGFFYFPGGSLGVNLTTVSKDAHLTLTNDQGTVINQDTSGNAANIPAQSMANGWYHFAVTAKDNQLTRYTLTFNATPVNVGWNSMSVAPTTVTRGGGEIVLNTQYVVANGVPQSLQIYTYLSADKVWDQNDKMIFGKYYTDADVTVGSHDMAIQAQAPVDFPLGNYYVIAKITCVGDSNAADNTAATASAPVTVIAAPTFTLSAANPKNTSISQDGHAFTMSYAGAGTVDVFTPGGFSNFGIGMIEIHGSDATSIVSVTTKDKGARLDITKIEGDGALKGLSLGSVNIPEDGDVTIAGGVKTLSLGNLAMFAKVTVGGAATDTMTATLDEVSNGSLISTASISTLKVTNWDAAFYSVLQAPSLGTLTTTGRKGNAKKQIDSLPGDFDADMTLNDGAPLANTTKVLGSAKIAGSVQNSVWGLTGYAGAIRIGGTLGGTSGSNAKISATGDIASIAAGKAEYLDVLVGTFALANGNDRHPANLAAVSAPHQTLGSFKISGLKGARANTILFNDVCISAYEMGTVTLKGAQLPAAAGDFGLFVNTIKSMKAVAVDRHTYSWPAKKTGVDTSGLVNLLA